MNERDSVADGIGNDDCLMLEVISRFNDSSLLGGALAYALCQY